MIYETKTDVARALGYDRVNQCSNVIDKKLRDGEIKEKPGTKYAKIQGKFVAMGEWTFYEIVK